MDVIEYILEIYPPDVFETPILTVKSSTPFPTIRRGDLINPRTFSTFDITHVKVRGLLRIVNVEHILWSSKQRGVKHKICLFTTDEPDTSETRSAGTELAPGSSQS